MKRLLLTLCLSVFGVASLLAGNYPQRSDVPWVTVPDHADWIYRTGEKASVEVQFYRYGIPQDGITVHYELGGDLMPADASGSVVLKHGRATIPVGTMKQPGFRDCRLSATVDGTTHRHHIKVGFSPERIEPYTQLPSDFKAFWDTNKAEAARFSLTYTKTLAPEYCTDRIDCYLVKLLLNKRGRAIYGYLFYPKNAEPGSCPVVLCPPGAGIKTIKEPLRHKYYAESGMIRFEIEIHGLNPTLPAETFKEISNAFNGRENGYLTNGLENRDNYYMKRVYLACVRAIDLVDLVARVGRTQCHRAGRKSRRCPVDHHRRIGQPRHGLCRQSSGLERHGRLQGWTRRRISAFLPHRRDGYARKTPHDGLLRRREFRTLRHSRHLSDVGIQRRHLPADHELRRLQHARMPERGINHPHQRALDIGSYRIRPLGVDPAASEIEGGGYSVSGASATT